MCLAKERNELYTGFWWENPEGKRPLGRPTPKWEHNTRIDIKEIEREATDWSHLAKDRHK
jgi:hypothetical protein